MKGTDTAAPEYFHKVVDRQWACPAHTPVPEYIRLIAQGRYADAYMVNWTSDGARRDALPTGGEGYDVITGVIACKAAVVT